MTTRLWALAGVVVITAAGCSGPEAAPKLSIVKLSGKVTLVGKPADRVTMTFNPVDPTKGREATYGIEGGTYALDVADLSCWT